LEEAEVTIHRGIPVTTIERTLMDIATRFAFRGLERAVVAASRTGQMSWDELQRLLTRTPNRRGVKRLHRVVSVVSPFAEDVRSPLEMDFLALCRSAGLPTPSVNVYVVDYLVDFLWSAQRVIVETDGFAYHSDRSAFERDRERTVALTAAGYEVHRATYRMLTRDPHSFLELVRHSLERRSASRLGGISPQT
jgi:hypothetical protein